MGCMGFMESILGVAVLSAEDARGLAVHTAKFTLNRTFTASRAVTCMLPVSWQQRCASPENELRSCIQLQTPFLQA